MSARAVAWAAERRCDSRAKLVLIALAIEANDEGVASPSIEYLAEWCGLSERTVQRALLDLIAAGWIVRDTAPGQVSVFHLRVGAVVGIAAGGRR